MLRNMKGVIEFQITTQTPEQVTGAMPVTPGIHNPFGIANAGAILWFADVCATVLAMGKVDASPGDAGFPLGVSLYANLVGNQKDGVFKATSTYVKRGRTLSVVRTVVTGADNRLIADVTTGHIPSK